MKNFIKINHALAAKKRKLLTLLFALMAGTIVVFAEKIEIDGLYFTPTSNSTVMVTYQAYESPDNYSNLISVSIPSAITYYDNIYSVTSIEREAFRQAKNLIDIFIPSSVTSIGAYAFDGCSSLNNVNIPTTVTKINACTFADCTNLKSINIPNGITNIEESAFTNSGLTSVVIPNSVKKLGYWAFKDCTKLKQVEIGNGLADFGSGVFANCTNLTYVRFTNLSKAESIGENMFEGCVNLPMIEIPQGVTSIKKYAFSGCSSLASVVMGDKVARVEYQAFYECNNFHSLTIGLSPLNTIEELAFYNCPITEIHYTGTIKDWCSKTWNPRNLSCHLYAYYQTYGSCNSYTLYIRGNRIENLVMPDNVTTIVKNAFVLCSSLKSIVISNSVTSIGDCAFSGCTSLDTIYNYAIIPQIIKGNVFDNVDKSKCHLIVPKESIELYKAANVWKDFLISDGTPEPQEDAITVRLDPQSASEWETVRLWAWTDKGNIFDAWPGQIIHQKDGWYSYTFDSSIKSVNIIWTDGIYQTLDITNVAESTCYALESQVGTHIGVNILDCSIGELIVPSYAHIKIGDLYYDLNPTDHTAVVTYQMFYYGNYAGLTNVEIPSTVTYDGITYTVIAIGNYAFCFCEDLQSITIPNSVTKIGLAAFGHCYGLSAITLPENLSVIGDNAFLDCTGLQSITCEAVVPPTLGSNVFANVDKTISLNILAESVDAYKAADQWKDFWQGASTAIQEQSVLLNSAQKILRNGQIYILRGDKTYTLQGQEVK